MTEEDMLGSLISSFFLVKFASQSTVICIGDMFGRKYMEMRDSIKLARKIKGIILHDIPLKNYQPETFHVIKLGVVENAATSMKLI